MEEIVFLNNGMNSDTDPSIQPNNAYRYGLNGNLVSLGENKYSYESVKGTKVSFQLPLYQSILLPNKENLQPIGFISLGKRLVVFSTNILGHGQIGLVTFNDAGDGSYEIMYHHNDLEFSLNHFIRGYGLEENAAYHRVYWTDNYNQPRSINLASKSLTTNLNPFTTPLEDGEQYMVLSKSGLFGVNHGVIYNMYNTNGNVFTYDSTVPITSIGTINVDYKIIKYVDYKLFNYTPERNVSSIDYYRSGATVGSGSLKTGVNQYTFRVYTVDGYYSAWSPLSNFIHITDTFQSNGYQTYQGASNTNSTKSVSLKISGIPTYFDRIQIGVFESWSSIEPIPDNSVNAAYIWLDERITGEEMIVTHRGQENLQTLTIEDVAISDALVTRAKDMVTLKQRQVLLNLSEREELTNYTPNVSVSPMAYKMPTDSSGDGTGGYMFHHNLNPAGGVLAIVPDGLYVVRKINDNGIAASATYRGTVYTEGKTFKGVYLDPAFTKNSNTKVMACIRIQQYVTNAGIPVYKIIDLHDEWFDYKSSAAQMYLQGYWRDETYRIGLMFHDKFGVPFAVKYGVDVTIPAQSSSSAYGLTEDFGSGQYISLRLMSLVMNNLDITDIKDRIGGVSIVRCEREQTIVAQGVASNLREKHGEGGVYVPMSVIDNGNLYDGGGYVEDWNQKQRTNIHSYYHGLISPDMNFGFGLAAGSFQQNDQIKCVGRLINVAQDGQDDGQAREQIYGKFVQAQTPASGQVVMLNGADEISEGGDLIPRFDTTITVKNYDIPHADGALSNNSGTNLACGSGGRKVLLAFNNSINRQNGQLTLVNYVRPRTASSLYGGTSDAAKANNKYIRTGYYLNIDSTVIADCFDPGTGRYVLNGMQFFGGDCFVNLYDHLHVSRNSTYGDGGTAGNNVYDYRGTSAKDGGYGTWAYTVIFPCESNVNVALREGKHPSRDGMSASAFDKNNGTVEEFNYNFAYSSSNVKIPYTPLPLDFKEVSRFPYMARYSELKILGQRQDNMIRYLTANFINVDALHGEITGGLVGADRLFYVQERGVGYLPVNERELSTSALGSPIQLGVGGIMNRADNVDRFYGCQHLTSIYSGPDHFGFFDYRRRAFLLMTYGGNVNDVSLVMGISNDFYERFEVNSLNSIGLHNTDNIYSGTGIVGVYDSRHKMGLMTFRFGEEYKRLDFTVGINPDLKCFIGYFSFTPSLYIEHNNNLYSTGITRLDSITSNTAYTVGQLIQGNTIQTRHIIYVCLLNYTTGSNATAPHIDTTHWAVAATEMDIHQYWRGDICKFFGVTYPYELEVVFKGNGQDVDREKTFDNIEVYGNDTALTDVYFSDSKRASQDTNIDSLNKNYGLVDNSWWFSVAQASSGERLLDHYMKMKVVVKNYINNPTISLNKLKRIVYLKTIYRNRL